MFVFTKRLLWLGIGLFCFSTTNAQTLDWSSFTDSIVSFSSPHTVELTGDNTLDVVIGGGTDGYPTTSGIMAFDGTDGSLLWKRPARNEMFTSAAFADVTGDNIPDIFMGGRDAELQAVNGATGALIWEFWTYGVTANPKDSGYYNFYSPQIIPDQNNDGVSDILVANGGDHAAFVTDTIRDPGMLMVLDGTNGNILGKDTMPDGRETYCSPVCANISGIGTLEIIFGSGGEYISGSLWRVKLADLLLNNISNATELVDGTATGKGFVAPPSLGYLDGDGALDIVAQGYDGTVYGIKGANNSVFYSVNVPGTESSAQPTIGNFTGNQVPDIFTVLYKGIAPAFTDYYQVLIDGATGQIVWMDSIADLHFASSVAFDCNHDGRDEVLATVNTVPGHYTHQLMMFDFQNDTQTVFYDSQGGVNFGCTPWVGDMDNDGLIEVLTAYRADSLNPVAASGIYLERINTNKTIPIQGIAWGAYMANKYDGIYSSLAGPCPGVNLLANAVSSNISCNSFDDGYVNLNISTGTAPYIINWDNGLQTDSIGGLTPGTYAVTVMDSAGCTSTANYTMSDPYVINMFQTNNNCYGDTNGTATIQSSGCSCMFSGCLYDWSNGVSGNHTIVGLGTGWYSVTLTHLDGCIVTDSVFILDGDPVIDSVQVIDPACYGAHDGEIITFASDTAATTYTWEHGDSTATINGLGTGMYTLFALNQFCLDTVDVMVNEPDSLHYLTLVANALCNGDSSGTIAFTGFGGTQAYDYVVDGNSYSNSTVSLPAGTYTISVTDAHNCTSDAEVVTISEPTAITVSFSATGETAPNAFDGSATASPSGGTPPYTYSWDDPSSQTTATATGLTAGTYTCTVTDANGCEYIDVCLVDFIYSVNAYETSFEVSVYPIPVNDVLNIEAEEAIQQIVITDSKGGIIYDQGFNSLKKVVISDLELARGVYSVSVYTKDSMRTLRFVFVE